MKYVTIIILLLLSSVVNACELSDEYKQATSKIIKWARYEHVECFHSVSEYLYWQRVSECKKEGRGNNIGGGCQHVEGYTNSGKAHINLSKHCEILKVSDVERERALARYVKERKIKKCKVSNVSNRNEE